MEANKLVPTLIWPTTIETARPLQEQLAKEVRLTPLNRLVATVAGVDAAFSGDKITAAVTLFDYNTLSLMEEAYATMLTPFPYIPGYLSFREAPAIFSAMEKLSLLPDLLIVDGQGIAHPRRIGIASFLGVLLGLPTIGCAKSRLVGRYEEPAPERGSWSPLIDKGETVGAVLRTRKGVKPVFVSPGHLVTLPEAIEIIMHCAVKYRLPEPQRAADSLAGKSKLIAD